MRYTTLPSCNRDFVRKSIRQNQRIDGRKRDERRPLDIEYGIEWGSCLVSLGDTRIHAYVSGDIVEPKDNRPLEGMLVINLDMSPMAAPEFDGRLHDRGIELMRILERSIRDSKCIDLESLCLVGHEKVWQITVDLVVLNHEGNLIEALSIAAIAGLAHFRRNQVCVSGRDITVRSLAEANPEPLVILHYPLCTSLAFFDRSRFSVTDPLEVEERVCDGYMIVGANSYQEVTTLHVSGKSDVQKDKLIDQVKKLMSYIKTLEERIKVSIKEDAQLRINKATGLPSKEVGFARKINDQTSALCSKRFHLTVPAVQIDAIPEEEVLKPREIEIDQTFSYSGRRGADMSAFVGGVGEGGPTKWSLGFEDAEEGELPEEEDDDNFFVLDKPVDTGPGSGTTSARSPPKPKPQTVDINDSEEEECFIIDKVE